jgi:phytoene dehydrogenase-like protein
MNSLRRSFDEVRYGGFPTTPLIGFGSLTAFDPSRVPEGRATLHAWDYVPFAHPGGRSWDKAKHDYAQRMLGYMSGYIGNLGPTDILQYHCDSPVDMERTSPSFRRGDLHGIASTTYQSGSHRPTPDLGQFTVPGSSACISSDPSSIRRRRVRRGTRDRDEDDGRPQDQPGGRNPEVSSRVAYRMAGR